MMKFFRLNVLLLVYWSCTTQVETAQSIIENTIMSHGGELYEMSVVEFDFRDRHYKLERDRGNFKYHRIFSDSSEVYHDILDNQGFSRTINNKTVVVDQEWSRRYSNSINSVAYFAYLPFGLNDPAVNKKLLEDEEINRKQYYKVQVTFEEEGGGEDHDDVFVYWINKENYRMEFFGYSYLTDGGGIRFREAVAQRDRNGILFSDYINYKGQNDNRDVAGLARLFANGELEKLSEIRIENLQVTPLGSME